jgi:hypothetical protein
MNDAAEDPRCKSENSQPCANKEKIEAETAHGVDSLDDILGNIAQALHDVKGVLTDAVESFPIEPQVAIAIRPSRPLSSEGSG